MAELGEGPSFVAIDFETADFGRDSACALGLVRVEKNRIVRRESRLIRPPRRDFVFTYIHGIAWEHVADAAPFGEVWSELSGIADGVDFLAAHNAPFDRAVLHACCLSARLEPPPLPFECTVRRSRKAWGIRPTTLPDVCRALDIELRHHDALSDAEACARIMIALLGGRAAL
jgi:DNA polymerase-3 subunit epsilon